jgi:hypothetical protein
LEDLSRTLGKLEYSCNFNLPFQSGIEVKPQLSSSYIVLKLAQSFRFFSPQPFDY